MTTTDDTKVTVTKTIKLSGLAVGDTVRVKGTTSGTTVAADAIEKGALGFGAGFRDELTRSRREAGAAGAPVGN